MLDILKKYRFIILFVLVLLFFICINNNVSAKSISFTYKDNLYTGELPPETVNYVISYLDYNYLTLHITTSSECVGAKLLERTYGLYLVFKDKGNINNNDITEKTCLSERRYTINLDSSNKTFTLSYRQSGYDGYFSSSTRKEHYIISSDIDVYNSSNNIIHNTDKTHSVPFYLEYNSTLESYVVYSNWYDVIEQNSNNMHLNYFQSNPLTVPSYFILETRDIEGWISMEGENEIGPGLEYNYTDEYINNITTKEELQGVKWRNGLQIVDYGTYYFCCYNYNTADKKGDCEIVRFVINENGNSYFETLEDNSMVNWINKTNIDANIDKDLKDNINKQNSYDYFKVFYSEDYESANIYTNWFLSDSEYSYVVDYSMDNVHFNDEVMIEEYTDVVDYFRYSINVYQNGTYYIRLCIYNSNNEESLVCTKTIQVKIRSIGVNDYRSDDTDVEYRLKNNSIYKFLKINLGALFYPIDLLFDFLTRLDRIDTVQPTIVVPTVREYFTNTVIINGFTYDLNSVLQNETFAQVYDIYLNFVDFILFIAISYHLYKVLKEFINFGGGII